MSIYIFTVFDCVTNLQHRIRMLCTWGTGVRGLTRGMTTLLQGNQEPLMVTDKVGRPQMSLGWAGPVDVILFPSVHTILMVGWQGGHTACKKLDVGLLVVTI